MVKQPIAGESVGVGIGGHSGVDDVAERVQHQASRLLRQVTAPHGRVQARLVQHFVPDPVADAGGKALVEEQRLDLRVRAQVSGKHTGPRTSRLRTGDEVAAIRSSSGASSMGSASAS